MKPCYSNFLRIAVEKDDFTHLVRMILITDEADFTKRGGIRIFARLMAP